MLTVFESIRAVVPINWPSQASRSTDDTSLKKFATHLQPFFKEAGGQTGPHHGPSGQSEVPQFQVQFRPHYAAWIQAIPSSARRLAHPTARLFLFG
jgi:hypothetical protein